MKETKSKGVIFFDKDTDFNGVIDASQLVLEGSVVGAVVSSETVFLRHGSSFQGDINTRKILAEEGSVHKGNLHLDDKRRKSALLKQYLAENRKTVRKEQKVSSAGVSEKAPEAPVSIPSRQSTELVGEVLPEKIPEVPARLSANQSPESSGDVTEKTPETPVIISSGESPEPAVVEKPVVRLW